MSIVEAKLKLLREITFRFDETEKNHKISDTQKKKNDVENQIFKNEQQKEMRICLAYLRFFAPRRGETQIFDKKGPSATRYRFGQSPGRGEGER